MKNSIVLSVVIFGLLYLLLQYVVRPFFQRRQLHAWFDSEKIQTAYQVLQQLFKTADGAALAKGDRERMGLDPYAFTYGEMPFITFAAILETLALKPQAVFYDLGSGTGKIVIAVALLHDVKRSVGIEFLPSLYQYSEQRKQALQTIDNLPAFCTPCQVQFFQGDYCEHDISDADLIYVNATGLFGDRWESLLQKLSALQPGCYIIITSKRLEKPSFCLIDARMRLMSWGMNRVFIYQVV